MRIWLNDKPIDLLAGMTVREALIQSKQMEELLKGAKVFDEWNNEMGVDGALIEGMHLYLKWPGLPQT